LHKINAYIDLVVGFEINTHRRWSEIASRVQFIYGRAPLNYSSAEHGEDLFKWATPRRFQLASQQFPRRNVHQQLQFVASPGVERKI
jgi:hypothetical protein